MERRVKEKETANRNRRSTEKPGQPMTVVGRSSTNARSEEKRVLCIIWEINAKEKTHRLKLMTQSVLIIKKKKDQTRPPKKGGVP